MVKNETNKYDIPKLRQRYKFEIKRHCDELMYSIEIKDTNSKDVWN